jgi:RNase P subunit RPR2
MIVKPNKIKKSICYICKQEITEGGIEFTTGDDGSSIVIIHCGCNFDDN